MDTDSNHQLIKEWFLSSAFLKLMKFDCFFQFYWSSNSLYAQTQGFR